MKCFLLTPYKQTEIGIVFFKMPTIHRDIFDNRVLIIPAPAEMQTRPSGVIDWQGNQTDKTSPEVVEWLKSEKVRSKFLTDSVLKEYVKNVRGCQFRDGKYCHHELTLTIIDDGYVKSCWHHDNGIRSGEVQSEKVRSILDNNKTQCLIRIVQAELGHNRPLTVSDVIFFCLKKECLSLVNTSVVDKFFNVHHCKDNKETSLSPFDEYAAVNRLKSAVVKLKFDDDPPLQYGNFKPLVFRSPKWTQFVKSQPCVVCGQRADDPHHLINQGGGKMGSKADDFDCIPLCRQHHNELHCNVQAFENKYGSQVELWHKFFLRAVAIGAIEEV